MDDFQQLNFNPIIINKKRHSDQEDSDLYFLSPNSP